MIGMVMSYRARHATTARGLVEAIRTVEPGCQVRLWALDDVIPALRAETLGAGLAPKFPVLNRLLGETKWAVTLVCDDDVHASPHTIDELLKAMWRYELDLAQPAHAPDSNASFDFCRQVPGIVARRTTFVESGPIIAIGPRLRSAFLPFRTTGMGWGLEVKWFGLAKAGARLGIVDRTTMRHVGVLGSAYDQRAEERRLRHELSRAGITSIAELQLVLEEYRDR